MRSTDTVSKDSSALLNDRHRVEQQEMHARAHCRQNGERLALLYIDVDGGSKEAVGLRRTSLVHIGVVSVGCIQRGTGSKELQETRAYSRQYDAVLAPVCGRGKRCCSAMGARVALVPLSVVPRGVA